MSFLKTISIVKKVHKDICNRGLFHNNEKILIALSGGQDSMSCLFFTFLIKKQFKVDIAFSSCNHLFQTDSFYSYENNISQTYAVGNSFSFSLCPYWVSNEKEARYWRYSILEKIACFYAFFSICFGHTETDRFETLILQLARGSGRDGVLSMQWKKKRIFIASPLESKTISYVRPLLGITRMETFLICKNWNIAFYSDRSNEFSFYKRNFLRKQIIYLLKKTLNPRIEGTICKFTEILAKEDSLLSDINKSLIWSCIFQSTHIRLSQPSPSFHEENQKRIYLIIKFINKAPLSIKRRFLKNILKKISFKGINFEKIQTLGDFFFQKKKESNPIGFGNSHVFFLSIYHSILIARPKKKRRNDFLIEGSDRKLLRNIHTNLSPQCVFSTFPFYYQVAIQFLLTKTIPQFASINSRLSLNFMHFLKKKYIHKSQKQDKKSFLSNLGTKKNFSPLINFVKARKEFVLSVYFIFVPGLGVSIFKFL